jgi:hypothetical protein
VVVQESRDTANAADLWKLSNLGAFSDARSRYDFEHGFGEREPDGYIRAFISPGKVLWQRSRLTGRKFVEASVPKERPQRRPGGICACVLSLPEPNSAGELEEFTEVCQLLVVHRFGASFTALVGGTEVKVDAMTADAEVSATGGAGFATSGLGRGIPFPTALMAVACHGERMTAWAKKKREAGLSAGL